MKTGQQLFKVLPLFRAVLASVLVGQIGFGYTAIAYATPSRPKLTAAHFAQPIIDNLMLDPVFAEFAKQPALPMPSFKKDDPAIDQDPFFLRSQSWGNLSTQADSKESSFTKEKDGSLTLNLPTARRSLHLNAPMTPVLATEQHIFLSVDQGSDLFAKASGPLENGMKVGEGVFFINVQEWLKASQISAPVKVYFFPLPGHGWTGAIEADHYADLETISLGSREGDWLPVSIADIEQVEKVQSLNAMMGAYVAAQSNGGQNLFPARGSTYGFGMLFTGFNLDASSFSKLSDTKLQPLVASIVKLLSIKEAKADVNVSAELVERLVHFGVAFGTFTAAAIALKYTLLRNKFAERNALRDLVKIPGFEADLTIPAKLVRAGIMSRADLAKASSETISQATGLNAEQVQNLRAAAQAVPVKPQAEPAKGFFGRMREAMSQAVEKAKSAVPQSIRRAATRAGHETVEMGDSLASVLTMVSQLPAVVTANTLERMADRHMPSMASGSNQLLRKTLNYTFLWSRAIATNTPVSLKTFMLGGVVMGGIDTYFVYFQQVAFIPAVANGLAPYLPPALEQRIYDTYDPNNAETRQLIANDVIRNFVAWLVSGASGYSQDSQAQVEPQIRKQVDDALKRMGKNPLAAENQEERDRMYRDVMNTRLKQLGLPDQMDFLFDVNTMDQKILEKLGFKLTEKELEKKGETSTVGEKRPALIASALRFAMNNLKKSLKEAPTDAKLKAYRILEDTRKSLTVFRFNPLQPAQSLRERRDILKMLSLLTYSGDVDMVVRHVPELWSNVDPDGAREAASRFRQAFFSFYNGDHTLVELPAKFISNNIDAAKEAAIGEISSKYGFDQAAQVLINTTYKAEFGHLVEQKLREKYATYVHQLNVTGGSNEDQNWYQRRQQAKNYQEAIHTMSWYQKIQHQRAYRKTMERALSENENVSQATLNKYYAEAMAHEVSLYPIATNEDERNMLEWVVINATSDTRTEMEQEALKLHMQKLSPAERSQIEMSLFAKNYLNNYRLAAIDQALVPPRSVAQPGFTQKFRQKHQDSKLLTIVSRIIDSGFSDEVGFQTGLKAKIYRNIPGAYDMWANIARLPKSMATATTVKWEFNRVVWGVNIPFASNFLFMLVSPLISAPSQWLNRAFRQQGLQPMGGLVSKIVYGVPYAWVTFGATIPWILYSRDARLAVDAVGLAVKNNVVVQTLTSFGETALPFLPALAVIPIIKEIRARREARKVSESAKNKLDVTEQAKAESQSIKIAKSKDGPSVLEQLNAKRTESTGFFQRLWNQVKTLFTGSSSFKTAETISTAGTTEKVSPMKPIGNPNFNARSCELLFKAE